MLSPAAGNAEYFQIESRAGQLVLTPMRMQRADAVRAKLAELNLGDDELAAAVTWARQATAPHKTTRRVVEPKAAYRARPRKRTPPHKS